MRLSAASLGLWALASLSAAPNVAAKDDKKPNIVMVLVDDQETIMNTMNHMPNVNKKLVDKGTWFQKHYCTIAVCCPSRVNIWTGQMAHNTNVTALGPPYGGFPKFMENGYNDKHLARWMKDESDYNTYYAGKLFNAHSIHNYNDPPMSGFTASEFLLEPYTYQYNNVTSTRNGKPPKHRDGYTTDYLSKVGMEFLNDALKDKDEKPFFLTMAPIAPHNYVIFGNDKHPEQGGPPVPAKRHQHMFKGEKIPRTKNFNPDKPSGVSWVKKLDKVPERTIDYYDYTHRRRMQALQSVDDMVGELIDRLEEAGVMDNTYFIYTSDNGFHMGHHRLPAGKELGFESDINVPFVVRGPKIPAGVKRRNPTSHTDIAPTIMKLAGNNIDNKKFDGLPMDLWEESEKGRAEHVAVEFWAAKFTDTHHSTYKGLRIEAEKYGFYYSVWCTNEKELYNMKDDYDQMENLVADSSKKDQKLIMGQTVGKVADRLDALMMITKTCKESTCTDPWKVLHPDGSVKSLEDALDKKYDSFYRDQVKIKWSGCKNGQLREFEGPMESSIKAFETDESAGSNLRAMNLNPYWSWW